MKCSRLCLSRRGSPRNSGAWSSDSCCKQGLWPLLILLANFHSQKGPVFCSRALSHTRGTGTTVPCTRAVVLVPRYERLYRSTAALCLMYTYTYFISHRRPCQVWHIYSILGHLHIPTVPTGMVPYASFIITGSCPTTEIQFFKGYVK